MYLWLNELYFRYFTVYFVLCGEYDCIISPILRGGAPPQGSGGDNGVKHKNKPTSLTKKGGLSPPPQKRGGE